MPTINVRVVANTGNAERELGAFTGKVNARFTSATANVAAFGVALNQLSDLAGKVAREMIAPLQRFAEFDTAMANIGTLGVENIGKMRSEIIDLGTRTAVPLADLTKGMYDVVSAGVDADAQIGVLELTARAARAGLAQTSDALELGAAVVKGYGLEWSATESILDQAFTTVRLGQTTFPDLASKMQQTIPLAAALKIETTELFGAFATLTGVTGSTAEVATQIKAIFSELAKPTKALADAVQRQAGTTVDALVQSQGLAGVLRVLQKETGGTASGMTELFGSVEAVTALLALSNSQYETFIDKTNQVAGATGALNEAYEIQAQTIQAKWLVLQNKVEARLFATLELMKPLILAVLDLAAALLDFDWQPFAIGATTAGAALASIQVATFITGLGGLGPALAIAAASFRAFATSVAVSLASIPVVGWVAAAVGALTTLGAWLALTRKSERDLAEERRRGAEQTLAVLEAERQRTEQAIATSGATAELTERQRQLNEQLEKQQIILAEAKIAEYREKVKDATRAIDDLQQRFFGTDGKTGMIARNLLGDPAQFESVMNFTARKFIEISDQLRSNASLSERRRQQLEDERKIYDEINRAVTAVVAAQSELNEAVEQRNRIGQALVPEKQDVVAAANDVVNTFREALERSPAQLSILPDARGPQAELIKLDFEKWLQDMNDINRLSLEARMIDEETFMQQRIDLLRIEQDEMRRIYGEDSAEFKKVALEKLAAEQQLADRKRDLAMQGLQTTLQIGASLMNAAQGISEELFEVGKAAALAQAVIDTYVGANKALATYPPPLSFIQAALVVATGLANVAKINATRFERRREGGYLGDGGRTVAAGNFGGGEDRLIIANSGEFIVSREATALHRALLEQINSDPESVGNVRMRGGGLVGAAAAAGGGGDVDRIVQAIRDIRIEVNAELDAIRFFRRHWPEFEKDEAERTVI